MGIISFIAVTLFATLWSVPAHAASFDCSKATTETEIAICNDDELSALDKLMDKVYNQALRSNDWRYFENDRDDAEIINNQREAIARQIECGKNSTCLSNFYFSRIYELLKWMDIFSENYNDNPVSELLSFSDYLNSDTDIRAISSNSETLTTVIVISDGDPSKIGRSASGTVFNENPISILIKWIGDNGKSQIQVLDNIGATAVQGVYVEVTNESFYLKENFTRGNRVSKYSPANRYKLSWSIDTSDSLGIHSTTGRMTKSFTYHRLGIMVNIISYTYLDCEIKELPTLIGDYNFQAIDQIIGFKEDYRLSSIDIPDKQGLINLMTVLSNREIHLISVEAFSYRHFDIAQRGFELLNSRRYPESKKNLECVKQAMVNK